MLNKNIIKKCLYCLSLLLLVILCGCEDDNNNEKNNQNKKVPIIDNVIIECFEKDNLYITGYNADKKVNENELETGKCYYMSLNFDINPYYNQYRDSFVFTVNYDGLDVEVDETNTSKVVPNKQSYELSFNYVLPGSPTKKINCGINIAVLDKGYINFSSPEARFYQEFKVEKGDYKYIVEQDNSVGVVGCYIDTKDIVIPSKAFGVDVTKVAYTNITNWQDMNTITFPDTLEMIDNETFKDCSNLTEMYIPANVKKIGNNVFDGCTNLKKITVSKENRSYDSREDCNAIIETKTEKLMYGCVNTVIPQSVRIIGGSAFKNISNIENITLPSRLERIEGEAFYNCNLIKQLDFPSTLNYIGSYAFKGCISLEKAILPGSVGTLGFGAFNECDNLTELVIPTVMSISVGHIGYYFGAENAEENGEFIPSSLKKVSCNFNSQQINDAYFLNCENIEEIKINGTIKVIGSSAFCNCKKIRTIELQETVEEIKNKAFYDCNSLEGFNFCESIKSIGDYAFFRCQKITEVLLLENVIEIGEGAFSSCDGMTKILIPTDLKVLEEKVLYGCNNLVEVEVPFTGNGNDKTNFGYLFGSVILDDNDTYVPSTLENVILRNGKIIDTNAFINCEHIKNITIPNEVEEIGDYAFFDCKSLENINTPSNLKIIGKEAFRGCLKLKKFEFISGIKSIGELSFYKCESLTEISIPDTLISIGSRSFGYCSSLLTIIVDEENPTYDSRNNSNSINKKDNTLVFGCKTTTIESSITKIEAYAFDGCLGVKEFTIPETINYIGFAAFTNCSNLEKLTMPSLNNGEARTLGYYFGAENNTDNVKYVPGKLIEVTIIDDTEICDYAFYDCASLITVNLPSTIVKIGEKSFSKCINLTKLNFDGNEETWNNINKGQDWNLNSNKIKVYFK